ncbi:anthrone oxygenase family protein [Microbacterium sp. P06]|uniref:anthrone oxygenase family protein n=1 Tax=Microbacterium sp. P06 TaxID=3366949 RepID=UPI00374588C9
MIVVATAVGSAVVGGIYAAFTVMVMPALHALPRDAAAAAMQRINRAAERGPFIVVFGATTVAAVALAVSQLRETPVAPAPLGAAALAVASTVVTVAFNVPLNRRLDREGAAFWNEYRRRWTAWNTVRAVAAVAAVAVLAATGGGARS